MILKTVSTGSTGNCYLLIAGSGETLILDCGIPIMEIKKALNWNIKNVVGVLCTHKHLDHSKSLKDFETMGIPICKPYETLLMNQFLSNSYFTVRTFDLTTIDGNWTHTNADGTPCPIYGFMIEHTEIGRMLYITDCEFVKWRFKNVNHILLGVNYDQELLSGDDAKKNHVVRGHMSIDTACEFVKANLSDRLQNVIICHLSSENADSDSFIEKMKKVAYGANVDVAVAGKSWDLKNPSECPF